MTLSRRIEKLEGQSLIGAEPLVILDSFVSVDGSSFIGSIQVVGVGEFRPQEGETDDEFEERVYSEIGEERPAKE